MEIKPRARMRWEARVGQYLNGKFCSLAFAQKPHKDKRVAFPQTVGRNTWQQDGRITTQHWKQKRWPGEHLRINAWRYGCNYHQFCEQLWGVVASLLRNRVKRMSSTQLEQLVRIRQVTSIPTSGILRTSAKLLRPDKPSKPSASCLNQQLS